METQWQYVNDAQTVVSRINPDGTQSSCSINAQEIKDYIASGGVILPKDS